MLGIVIIACIIVWEHVIVEVVIVSHANEEDAFGDPACYTICTKPVGDLIKRALEVLDLLVERYSTHLQKIDHWDLLLKCIFYFLTS